jgi:hypothetical protein
MFDQLKNLETLGKTLVDFIAEQRKRMLAIEIAQEEILSILKFTKNMENKHD